MRGSARSADAYTSSIMRATAGTSTRPSATAPTSRRSTTSASTIRSASWARCSRAGNSCQRGNLQSESVSSVRATTSSTIPPVSQVRLPDGLRALRPLQSHHRPRVQEAGLLNNEPLYLAVADRASQPPHVPEKPRPSSIDPKKPRADSGRGLHRLLCQLLGNNNNSNNNNNNSSNSNNNNNNSNSTTTPTKWLARSGLPRLPCPTSRRRTLLLVPQ